MFLGCVVIMLKICTIVRIIDWYLDIFWRELGSWLFGALLLLIDR